MPRNQSPQPPGLKKEPHSEHTFSSTVELDVDLLVEILCQVENIFLFGFLLGLIGVLLRAASTSASATIATPSVASTAATEMASL